MLNYAVHAENQSLYNTPPVFAIYVMRLVMTWLLKNGGLEAMDAAQRSARPTSSTPRSIAPATTAATPHKDCRSRMNVTFRLPQRGPRKEVRQGGHRRRPRRPEGPPLGRRHAGLDLQRLPRGGRRRPGGIHAGVRARRTADDCRINRLTGVHKSYNTVPSEPAILSGSRFI